MRRQVKNETDILKKATDLVSEEFGIEKNALKLSYKQKNGIFYTFQFTSKEKAYMEYHRPSYHVTMNVAGIPMDIYKN
ncbi:MAG: hypothetical protein KI791_04055 [Cyclobacteriaceae bacterium]|nr:hypothetical protein [Cyclobacteriaceae bacterium SS2]